MLRIRKVVTSPTVRTKEPSALLNTDNRTRSIAVGARADEKNVSRGLIGKAAEHSGGTDILDFGVWCDLAFPHVIGVFGTRGSGKSFDLGVFVECIAGVSDVVDSPVPAASTIVFDVQNQFWTLALAPDDLLAEDADQISALRQWGLNPAALKNVMLWRPTGCETTLPGTVEFKISPSQLSDEDWLSLLALERYSALGQALLTLLRKADDCRPEALAKMISPSLLSSFQLPTIDALRWRLEGLADTGLVGEPGTAIEEFLVPGRISVLLLRDLPDSLRSLTVGVLVRIVAKRMSAHHQAERVARRHGTQRPSGVLPERLWVVMDEAHVIIPRESSTPASEPVVDYVKRGRDAGLSLIFATQQPSAVDTRLMSQLDISVTHALAFEADLQAAVARMPTRSAVQYEKGAFLLSNLGDALRALAPGEAILADTSNGRVFCLRIRPRLSAHGGNTPTIELGSE